MGIPTETPARVFANRSLERVHRALKPLLIAAGVRTVEERIGRPKRFFQKARERDALRLSDFLATCATLDQDPAQLLEQALDGNIEPEIRPPRILARARRQIEKELPGLGADVLADFETSLQIDPEKTRRAITGAMSHASREEVPRLLGFYGSCLRVESDLARAEMVLKEALEMVRSDRFAAAESDLLIRLSYVALEQQRVTRALSYSMEATLASARLEDRDGEGRGFLATGMLRYYAHDHERAMRDFEAALKRAEAPRHLFAAHQGRAWCLLADGDEVEARREAVKARHLAAEVAPWVVAKLDWFESRLTNGSERLELLAAARAHLCPKRPVDCALVTIELIEEALSLEKFEIAERATSGLCAVIDKTPNPQVESSLIQLVRQRTRLTPRLLGNVRLALERAQDRRLSRFASSE